MAELGVAYISVVPDTSKLAPAIKGTANSAATQAGSESGKTFGSKFSGAVGSALKTAGKAGLIGAGLAAGTTILGGVKSAIDQDKAEATLSGLYGSAKTASKLMKDLGKVASTSTIDYSSYTKAAQALAYMGVEGKDAPGMLENIGDAISGAGGGAEEMDRASDALLNMVNAGEVQLDTLNQLSGAGVPIFSALADTMGVSVKNLRSMVSEGKVGIPDVLNAVDEAAGKSWKAQRQAARNNEKTLSGSFAMLKDNAVRTLGTMFRPAVEGLTGFVSTANKWLVSGGISTALQRVKSMFAGLGTALAPLGDAVMNVFSAMGDYIRDAIPAMVSIGKALAPFAKFVAGAAIGALIVAFRALAPVIRLVGNLIGALGNFAENHTTTFRILAGAVLGGVAAWKAYRIATAATMAVQKAIAGQLITTRIGLVALKVQAIATAVAQRTVAAATKAWAIAQRLLNVAMRANLIGIVITALIALGTALVVAYKKSATFRKIVQGAWKGIQAAASFAWKRVLRPTFDALGKAVRAVGSVYSWLWTKIIRPVMGWIGDRISTVWKSYIQPILSVFASVLTGDLGGAWKKLKNLASNALTGIVSAVKAVPGKLRALADTFLSAGKALMGALFDGLKKVGGGALGIGKSIANGVIGFINAAIDKLNDLLELKIEGPGPLPDINLNPPDIPGIPQFAAGGRATRPTLAWVGEGREAESILPDSVLRSLMRAAGAAAAAATTSGARHTGGTAPAARGRRLRGGDDQLGNPLGDGRAIERAWRTKISPALANFTRTTKTAGQQTGVMSRDVDTATTKIAKSWTVLRRGPLKRFSQDWHRSLSRDAVADVDALRKRSVNNTDWVANDFLRFRRGPLASFSQGWRTTFRERTPDDVAAFRDKTLTQFGRVRDGMRRIWSDRIRPMLRDFGTYPRQTIAPLFRAGVDAIGAAWSRIENKVARPIRFVVRTVLNKALRGGFNQVAKFVNADKMPAITLPKGFRGGGYTGRKARNAFAGYVHGDEYVLRSESQRSIEKTQPGFLDKLNRLGAKALPGHRDGGIVDPDKRVSVDGEPLSAVHAAQLALASHMSHTPIHVMQGSWQPATSYSGTSHMGPGVADTSPGNFSQQKWQRKVAIAAWGRNFPGAAYAGSGAHIHGVSLLSPGARSQGQRDDYLNGGDGLGGSDYGPRPTVLPNLQDLLKRFPVPTDLGGGPMLPDWAQKIMAGSTKWAKGLLDGGATLGNAGPFGGLVQTTLHTLAEPLAQWAVGQLRKFGGAAGDFGGGAAGVWKSLMSTRWYSKKQAAGVMGNMMSESGFQPNIIQGGGTSMNPAAAGSGGYGLVQWTPGSKLIPYLHGRPPTVAAQIDALTAQLQGKGPSPESAAGQALKAAKSVAQAALIFETQYERHAGPPQPSRISQAQAIFERFAHDQGGLARGTGLMSKQVIQPERVLSPRHTIAFERMVAANFQPGGASASQQQPQRVEMTITNWDKGSGYIRGLAGQEMSSQAAHGRIMDRM